MKFLSANKFITAALTLCISACVFVFIISVQQTQKVKSTSSEVIHTNKVLASLDEIITTTLDVQNSTRGYVITGDEDMLPPLKNAKVSYVKALGVIKQQEERTSIYAAQLDSLERFIAKRLAISDSIIELRMQQKTAAAAALVASGTGSFYSATIRNLCARIKMNELLRQDATRTSNEKAIFGLNTILYTALITVILLGILLFQKVRKGFNQHRSGEEKFKALLESAPDAMLVTDSHGKIQLVNKQAISMLGYSRQELTEMSVEDLLEPELRDKHKSFVEEYAKDPYVRSFKEGMEMQAFNKSGKAIPVEICLSPIDTNSQMFIVASLRDISARKAAQQEIQTLFTQINQASEAIYVVTEGLVISSWNKGAENLYGYSKAEAIGKSSLQLLKTELTKEDMDNALRQIEETGFWSGEVKRFNKQGGEIYVYSSLSEVKNSNGQPKSYVSVSFDISQRKKLEERINHLASIVENSSEAILSRDMNRHIISWNKGAEKMFGISKDEAIGKTITDLGIMRISEGMKSNIEKVIGSAGEWQEEINYYHKNGNIITGAVTGNAVRDAKGNITALSFVIKDITARKQLEEHLRRYNDELEQKIRERTREIGLSESKYRLLYNNNPMPMFVLDLETFRYLDINDAAERLYGYSREEFQSMTALDIRPEEDKAAFLKQDHSFGASQTNRQRGLWRHIKKDGTVINVEIFGHSIVFENRNARLILVNDVTEKIRAQQKLISSEKRFRALIENSYDIIIMLDKDFKVLYRSPSTNRITGRSDEETKGMDVREFIHPDDISIMEAKAPDLFSRAGNTVELTLRYQHKNGSSMWFEGNATNLLHDESVQAIVFNYRDVTEKIAARQELASSEKRFRALTENSYDIITMLDKDFHVLYRSPSAIRVTGRENGDVLGLDGRKRIHPDDMKIVEAGIRRLMAAPGNVEECIFRYLHKDGTYMWFEGNATNLLHDESVQAIVFNYRDVTERVMAQQKVAASEKRFRSAMDNMIEGVQIIGFDWKYKYVNNAAVKQAKCSAEELLGHSITEKYPGIENSDLYQAMKTCLDNRNPVLLENKFTYNDQAEAWFELSIQPVQEGIFILSVDITERVEASRALKEEKDKLSNIATTSPGLIYSFRMTPEGTISFPFVSNAVEDIFGYTSETLKNTALNPLLESALPDDIELVSNSIWQSALNMSPWQQVFRYNHPVKGLRWLEGNSLPAKEKDGSTIWHGIVMDITDRKKTEEKITEKNAQLETLSNNLPGVMIYQLTVDDFGDRKFTYVSKEVSRITGKTPEEVMADPGILYKTLHEEDLPVFLEAEKKSFANMSVFNEEIRVKNFNGETRWLNIVSTPRKSIGGKLVWDGFHVDITERKKSEAALRSSYIEKRMLAEKLTTILNTLPANIALLDENGIIVDVNQAWMEFASANGLYGSSYGIGANYIALTENTNTFDYDHTDRQEVASGIKAVLSKTADRFVYEYSCHTINNKHWFRKIISPLSGDGYTGAVVMHIDVSQIHWLEQEKINRKTEEQKIITAAILQGQEKERNAIGKELHDNINQILAGMSMLMGLLLQKPERLSELLPLCIDNVNLAIKENRKLAHELASPNEYEESLVELIKRITKNMLQNAGITIRIDHKNFDELLLTNEQKLAAYRIVQEQCNNILKYANAKKVVFLLHTSDISFLLIIKDNGQGMEPGRQHDGIGLQNIKSRVNVFNGHVNITTKPGAGFMLSVEIPLVNIA